MTDTTATPESSANDHNKLMYEGLGHVVRALHDALTYVGADDALAEATHEFPSARERLIHVAELTEKAANTVLNKVDETLPIQQKIESEATALAQQWEANAVENLSKEQLLALGAQTRAHLAASSVASATMQQALTDIMMAQDFQDLTGQLIKKVVAVLERTETDLLRLLISGAPADKVAAIPKPEELAGPGAVGDVAMDQSDIDAMLADLGF
jgi:chemotaxis protein CheZ